MTIHTDDTTFGRPEMNIIGYFPLFRVFLVLISRILSVNGTLCGNTKLIEWRHGSKPDLDPPFLSLLTFDPFLFSFHSVPFLIRSFCSSANFDFTRNNRKDRSCSLFIIQRMERTGERPVGPNPRF